MTLIEFIHLRPYSDSNHGTAKQILGEMAVSFEAAYGLKLLVLESNALGNDLALAVFCEGESTGELSKVIQLALNPYGDVSVRYWRIVNN